MHSRRREHLHPRGPPHLDDCVTHLLPELTTTATPIQTDLHTASRVTHVPSPGPHPHRGDPVR
ncbi:hypothetical protein [Streptomyces sp. NPDC051636]|uniref:hypothetical protein n=1 Tax=Streptomyces sp. NPDC051636 TaxID=3365663 RepID=UPI0037917A94